MLSSGKKITRGEFTEVPTPKIVMKQVVEMALAKKQNEGLIFENCTGATVNNILPNENANVAFSKIDRNIIGVDWEAEIQDPAAHIPKLNNNQYATLAGEEENE